MARFCRLVLKPSQKGFSGSRVNQYNDATIQ